jgi:hypothetical protein
MSLESDVGMISTGESRRTRKKTCPSASYRVKDTYAESAAAAAELPFVYNSVVHRHNYLPTDCGIKLLSTIFKDSKLSDKLHFGRTKCKMFVQNILAPDSVEELLSGLKD